METKDKKVFESIGWRKKMFNRLDYQGRFFIGLTLLLFITSTPRIRDALRNQNLHDVREKWILNKVRDINNQDFARLDEEEPPKPLPSQI